MLNEHAHISESRHYECRKIMAETSKEETFWLFMIKIMYIGVIILVNF